MTRSLLPRRIAVATAAVGLASVVGVAPPASAEPNLVDTIRCNSADPWAPPWAPAQVPIAVDVYNDVAFPPDGAQPPVLFLSANTLRSASIVEYTIETTVRWTNTSTGALGTVVIGSRGTSVNWQGSIPSGRGHVAFTISQKIGAMAFTPMVNPQYSSCGGSAMV